MNRRSLFALLLVLVSSGGVGRADSAPFGVASAFSLVALGTVDSHGNTVLAGTIGTQADVQGRMAAAGLITKSTTVGSKLGSDPFGSLAGGYAIVTGTGISSGNYFNVNGGGKVYAPTNHGGYNWNESPRGSLVTSGPSPIDFNSLRSFMDTETLILASLTANGTVGAPTPKGGNPSWLVLSGTSTTLNVFTVTADQFASANHPLDIQVPVGSTVVINVQGTNVTLGTGIYFNGQQESDTNDDGNKILFNFAGASHVTIDGQFDGALLAPFAILTGGSQMGGNFIAAQIGLTGEVHNDEFSGTIPTVPNVVPEPWTLALVGSGLLAMAILARRKRIA